MFEVTVAENSGVQGFFTTRYIEAKNEEEATKIALDLIKKELKDNVERESKYTPKMFIKVIAELESFENAKIPGSGFSWFKS